jgi:hypothetical protein
VLAEAAPPLIVPVPITVAPSRKLTVPVACEAKVAVSVTDCPLMEGFGVEETAIVVVAFVAVVVWLALAEE